MRVVLQVVSNLMTPAPQSKLRTIAVGHSLQHGTSPVPLNQYVVELTGSWSAPDDSVVQ
jgi:hypothetical protein